MKLQMKPSDLLIVDRWLDVAYISLWFAYGLWGVTTLILGLPTLNQFTPDWYQVAWSGTIGCLAITAALFATLPFFNTPWLDQITKKRAELAAVVVLCAFIAVYPGLLIVRIAMGDALIVGGTTVLALSYLIFPFYRVHTLRKRIKILREVTKNATRNS